jgi:3,4-dihydroxy-2-butanone 4-phosphate synthase
MEEQALNVAFEMLREKKCIAILDLKSKEAKTALFFPTTFLSPLSLRILRTKAGGELYIFVVHEVAFTFGFPFIGKVSITHLELAQIIRSLVSRRISRVIF